MNKDRRERLTKLVLQKLEDARGDLQAILEEEQDAYDNLPESFQNGEKGIVMQEGIDDMATVIDEIDGAVISVEDIVNK